MRRVVVTGLGLVTPLACGTEQTWQLLLAGKSGIKRIEKFEVADLACKIAGQIRRGDGSDGTFNADDWMEPKEQRKVDDFIIFAMAAATQALNDAGWQPRERDDQIVSGVLIGSGIGGVEGLAETALLLRDRGPRRVLFPAGLSIWRRAMCRSRIRSRGPITRWSPLVRPARMRSAMPPG
jgi:3-oxoacyl-[acyl-carrier-protein] synthase II